MSTHRRLLSGEPVETYLTKEDMRPVLLVDDEEIFNFIMSRTLKTMVGDLEILTAQNGKEAIHLLKNLVNNKLEVPSIIFLDINMPVMDGFEFLAAYNSLEVQRDGTRIVMVSSSNHSKDIAKAESQGVTDFLLKPIDEKMLSKFFQ
jgi:CheY-like chemotaxis protein